MGISPATSNPHCPSTRSASIPLSASWYPRHQRYPTRTHDASALAPALPTRALSPPQCAVTSNPNWSVADTPNCVTASATHPQPPHAAPIMPLGLHGQPWFACLMTELAMFPLGSVLFPHMPVLLRVFEDRYLTMLARILTDEPSEFGVVLIERGQEVGGGEHRFTVGTIAQIAQLETTDAAVVVVAEGAARIEVVEWLDDDPYPRASVLALDDLEWDAALEPLLERAEQTVRRALAVAGEFSDQVWSATVEISDDPIEAAWQLAAIAPLGQLDQVALLASATTERLLSALIEVTIAAEETLRLSWPDEVDETPTDPSE